MEQHQVPLEEQARQAARYRGAGTATSNVQPPANQADDTIQQPISTPPARPSNDGHTQQGTTDRQPPRTWRDVMATTSQRFRTALRSYLPPQRRTQPANPGREESTMTTHTPKAHSSLFRNLLSLLTAVVMLMTISYAVAVQRAQESLIDQLNNQLNVKIENTTNPGGAAFNFVTSPFQAWYAHPFIGTIIVAVIVIVVWRRLKNRKAETTHSN